ncbi:hypothetical protein STCU_05204 [Strigomonas culicis]|uniref:Uncharacterized protein n=1 Tax=Strigomonas culicis TaxID=28005 RepID=S9UH77_9TRYP|nr:hypothetical protein STCU_05204 [Strigomonas culicis]|eukprot:EPY28293.1 hypothetical protein STCU_05204 [Strigomonas culicis]
MVELLRALQREREKERNAKDKYSHVNPEGLKDVFRRCGLMLTTDDYQKITLAYKDPVGFIQLQPLVGDLSPINCLSPSQMGTLRRVFPAAASTEKTASGSLEVLPPVTLSSAIDLLLGLLSPVEGADAEGNVAANNTSAALQSIYEDAAAVFTLENYPGDAVPAVDVMNYLAACLLLLPKQAGGGAAAAAMEARLATAEPLVPVPPVDPAAAAFPGGATNTQSCMIHTGVRTDRKFDRYLSEDRRDEWLRGRDERDARGMYQKHVCGYSGHLPEFRYHFGRTFHIIEEDLPQLTVPKPPQEPVTPEAFGKPMELTYSRMSVHHHKFA